MNGIRSAVFVAFSLLLGGCGEKPSVVQGTVVSYDKASHVLVMQDEVAPHQALTLDTGSALIAIAPQAGNVVRLAYYNRGGRLVAHRVMNLGAAPEAGRGGGK
jgi:type IV pilus biogenesis protein CpaD/CtpE